MKEFFKKYTGLILAAIMIGLFFWAYKITPTNPKLAMVFIHIMAWYLTIIFGLIVMYLVLKLFLWYLIFLRTTNKLHLNYTTPVFLLFFILLIMFPESIIGLLFIFAILLLITLLVDQNNEKN